MRYMKPETEIVEFEGYVYTTDYDGLWNSNNNITDGDDNHMGETDMPDDGGW